MCLIILSPAGHTPPEKHFTRAAKQHPDGFGIMSINGVEKHPRYLPLMYEQVIKPLHDVEYAVHFRWATHGDICDTNTHPYPLKDGRWLMHNGVLQVDTSRATHLSDTWHYINQTIDPGIDLCGPDQEIDWDWVGKDIKPNNKFVVMATDGTFTVVNRASGVDRDGAWYSNSSAFSDYSYRSYSSPWSKYDEISSLGWSVIELLHALSEDPRIGPFTDHIHLYDMGDDGIENLVDDITEYLNSSPGDESLDSEAPFDNYVFLDDYPDNPSYETQWRKKQGLPNLFRPERS